MGMKIEILNWPEPPWEVDFGRVKRTGRGVSIGVVRHICMEATQGNFLCSYLFFKLAKMSCFSIYHYVFSSKNSWNRKTENRFC
jgi:hypothetical protein